MPTTQKHTTREGWLLEAVELMTPLFKSKGYKVPKIRVTCGWPSIKGLSRKSRRIGEAWSTDSSADKTGEIFISPFLADPLAEQGVLATLVHEVVHEVVGVEAGHKGPFPKCAKQVGLDGKMTATVAGPDLIEFMGEWTEKLGPYPHASLDLTKSPTKKQSTRMIKMECEKCGYVARTAKKWLEEYGALTCACGGGKMVFEMPAEVEEGGDE